MSTPQRPAMQLSQRFSLSSQHSEQLDEIVAAGLDGGGLHVLSS